MKNMNPKMAYLLIEGISINTLDNLNHSQINLLYEKVKKSKKETKESTTKTTTSTTYSKDEVKGKTFNKKEGLDVTINQDDSVTVTKEGEVLEKVFSKKKQKLFNLFKGKQKGSLNKKSKSVSTEKKIDDKKFELTNHKELTKRKNKKEEVKNLEESIINLINSHIYPNITKYELLNTIKKYK